MSVKAEGTSCSINISYLAPAADSDSLIAQQSHFFSLHDGL
jgi:hypothetical protein